MTIIYL